MVDHNQDEHDASCNGCDMATGRDADGMFYVDIPSAELVDNPEAAWVNINSFETQAEALKYAQDVFGADALGRVNLVPSVPDAAQERLEAAGPALLAAAKFARSVLSIAPMEMSERMAIEKLNAALSLAGVHMPDCSGDCETMPDGRLACATPIETV